MIRPVTNICPEDQEMRQAFGSALIGMAEKDHNMIVMDCDLMGASGTKAFAKAFPEQTINCGIQEANAVGVAAGLSAVGKIPFLHSFAPFLTRRACDQIFISGACARLNVKLVGSDPGIMSEINGGTHMPFEDMGIMMGIPTMTVLEPTDIAMMKSVLPQIKDTYGMFYIRLVRKACMKIYEDGSEFKIGEAVRLREGTDATVIASGYCVAEAVKAAELLEKEGMKVRVLDMFTWKPLDKESVISAARETGAIVTAENHNVLTGLGSAVAEAVVGSCPVPVEMIGVKDQFGEVGRVAYLSERYHLNAVDIADAVKKAVSRKKAAR